MCAAREALSTRLWDLQSSISFEFPNGWVPSDLSHAVIHVRNLEAYLHMSFQDGQSLPTEFQPEYLPLIRLAIEEHIERLVFAQEDSARRTYLEEPQKVLADQIDVGHALLNRPPLDQVIDFPVFSLAQYLNLETITRVLGAGASLPKRIFDEKFHILTSQSLFLADLRYFREQCTLRRRPVSVAYIDIDKFGDFNRKLPGKETQVDRDVLPRFMSALEVFVYGRGFAYREGGDEYLVLLPNSTHVEAEQFFGALRIHLAAVSYEITIPGPTVSIGVCTAEASDRLTPHQIQLFANKAKAFAKDSGRNRVAGYRIGSPHSAETLTIFL